MVAFEVGSNLDILTFTSLFLISNPHFFTDVSILWGNSMFLYYYGKLHVSAVLWGTPCFCCNIMGNSMFLHYVKIFNLTDVSLWEIPCFCIMGNSMFLYY